MFPRAEVYPAVVAALLCKGRTVPEIEGGERGGRAHRGDRAQARLRNERVWHTKESVDKYVAKRLGVRPTVWGAGRTTYEFQQATATTIIKLRKGGKLVDWAKGRRYNIYRLADGHGLGLERPLLRRAAGGVSAGKRQGMCKQKGPYTDSNRMELFMHILKGGAKDNTYKFALARALLELCSERGPDAGGPYVIEYEKLAERFLRYYWRQECVFHIRQHHHPNREAAAIKAIRGKWGSMTAHDDFDMLDGDDVRHVTGRIERDVFGSERAKKSLVVPKFQKVKCARYAEEVQMFYVHDAKKRQITVRAAACDFFRRNYDILRNAVGFEWAKYLERANGGLPGLIAKVESVRTTPARNTAYIKKAKEALLSPRTKCFYCRCRLDRKEVELDHVIPWSFIFDDQLWNLVPACGGCNGHKSNLLPDRRTYEELVARNEKCAGRIGKLSESLKLLGRGEDWKKAMRDYYKSCEDYKFLVMPADEIRQGRSGGVCMDEAQRPRPRRRGRTQPARGAGPGGGRGKEARMRGGARRPAPAPAPAATGP